MRRSEYELYVSSIVEDEIGQGNLALAEKRLALVADLPRLAVTDAVRALAVELHAYLHLPPVAKADAIHLALACHYEMDYLLTWNLKHLAGGHVRYALMRLHNAKGLAIPTICTPEELLLDWSDEL